MLIHDLVQGSTDWHAHRAKYKNASDTPVIMGLSKYKSRTQYMNERKNGIIPEFDDATQLRFNEGHRFETLARPLAEKIVGKDLYPVTGTDGEYGASFDGLDMNESIAFEHKTLNEDLRHAESSSDLDEMYLVQMEHQLMVSGAEKCLFMASIWDLNNNFVEEIHFWYHTDVNRRQSIIDAWNQFDKDFAVYVPLEEKEKPKAQAIMALPALSIQIKGEVTLSNLPEFKAAATSFIENIKTELVTDEDFANAESVCGFCDDAEKQIELTKKSAIAQTASIDELMRTMDFIKDQLRNKRLLLEKLVKSEKESRKSQIVTEAREKFNAHLDSHLPTRLRVQIPDFAGATKSKKTLSSMKEAVNQVLINSKIEIDALARDINRKLEWFKDIAKGYEFLFVDLQDVIYKPNEDFQLLVNSRIKSQKEVESEKEVQIARDAEAALIAKQKAVTELDQKPLQLDEVLEKVAPVEISNAFKNEAHNFTGPVPTAMEMISALASAFYTTDEQAYSWIINTDFSEFKKVA